MASRPITELLRIIGADDGLPLYEFDPRTLAAYQAGQITNAEARALQSFGRRSAKGQKRALADARPLAPGAIEEMQAKLAAMSEQLHQRYPDLRGDDVV